MPLGTPYPMVVGRLQALVSLPALAGAALAVDGTGVGRGVLEFLRAGLPRTSITPVIITGGITESRDGSALHVPKVALLSELVVAAESGSLRVAEKMQGADILRREIQRFRVRTTATSETARAAALTTMRCWRSRSAPMR
jgi:hypothetical protein